MKMRVASIAAVAIVIAFGLPARAMDPADWTSQGGAVDEPGKKSIDVAVGFPSVAVTAHLPIVRHLEIDPFAEVFYWGAVNSTDPLVGTLLGARLKINVVDRGSLQIALMADLGAGVTFYEDTGFLLNLKFPQLVISGKVAEKVHIFGGMKIPIQVMVHPDFKLQLTFAGSIGAEFLVTDTIHVYLSVDGGPQLEWTKKLNPAPGDDSFSIDVNGWLSTSVGVAVKF